MSSTGKHYSGSGGSAINLAYPRASRQTEEQGLTSGSRQRQPPPADDEQGDDGWTVEKPHTSSIRYDRSYSYRSPRQSNQDKRNPRRTQLVRPRRRWLGRVLIATGLGLLALSLGIMAYTSLAFWWQVHSDDVTYGRPRTYQTDQFVGHGDSPTHPNHFIALNLNGVVEVLEINPHNNQLDRGYSITTTNPLNPVTLSFPTIEGKQYIYISIGDSSSAFTIAMVNDGKEFTGIQH